ncbi:MAG: hypothetical protein K9M07_05805 [Simkaniaceae bacterium]|nr:hypothetical protein [Simkaniaceae bacterium]MCF7852735.1 hypothetical protein [Simkaniaceae bacterium]
MKKKHLNELIKTLNSQFNGLLVSSIVNGHGSFLMIDFGEKIDIQYSDQSIETRAPWILWLYMCSWRITRGAHYLVGSGDKQTKIRKHIPFLVDKKLINSSVNLQSLDLQLTFENDIKIETFSKVQSGDQWKLYRPDGLTFSIECFGQISLRE